MTDVWAKTPAPAAVLAVFSGIAFLFGALAQNTPASSNGSDLPTLRQVEEIRRLSLSDAKKHYPVKLRGVVLDYSSLPTLFVSDGTNGIFVRIATNQIFSQGEVLQIQGVSDAGRFSPVIVPSSLQIVGESELPAPREVSFQRIASGAEDSQWVRVAGIVRSVTTRTLLGKLGKLTCPELTLATEDGGRLRVLVNNYHGIPLQTLVDAEVVATGIVESIYNGKRQLINVRLLTPSIQFVKVTRAAPQDLSPASARPIDSLRQFSPDKPSEHRVKVRGTVTLQKPGECIFIQDGTGSIRVETRQTDAVMPGDIVEALGFPAVYDYTPVMEDAVFRRIGAGPPPAPVTLTARQIRGSNHDADLVCLNAQLLDQYQTPDQFIFVLQEGDILFRAQLARSEAAHMNLRNGSLLRVTGICLTEGQNYRLPQQTFQIILRAPADLVVLREPSWWTPARLQWTLCLLTVGLLAAAFWVWTLRRQVRRQTMTIREKIEREAVLQERMRIARELHDNLEQELAGVRMQLELTAATVLNAPESAAANLQMAKTMVSHSQAEARRSVWELRSQVLEDRTLPAALSATAGVVENGAPIEVKVSGHTRTLPMRVESNLLRIAQEAMTNAIKHGKARHITVHLDYETNGTRLKISDDGCGFRVESAPDGRTGHFGLLGMRERVDKIAGSLKVISAPGEGTSVNVFVPQMEEDARNLP
ncbi:MAG TPA: sensor histidine kinase [Verrucomicrobiae bacterium]|jgi:signal transduction histidine kinase|nr:sensor histidine kinase [Verrucomicrobiae bacterium]